MNEKTDVFVKEVTLAIIEKHDSEEQGYILKSLLTNVKEHHDNKVNSERNALDAAEKCRDVFLNAFKPLDDEPDKL